MRRYIEGKLDEITCNNCGESREVANDEHGWEAEPFREFDLVYGYGSVLYDFSGVRFDLCEHCVEEILKGFKHEAERRDYELIKGNGGKLCYDFVNKREVSE